ncbi:MAG: DUF2813 domain-containing protein [Planctomycetota bacterium]|nr:DUF2813 domain-containing protein [Planctomycetota bacterium]
MLTQLKIERFRGILSLTLEDFSNVNVFVGENSAGKTSVLESVALVANPTNPTLSTRLGIWRELPPPSAANDDAISSLFHRCDVSLEPSFEFTVDGAEQKLTISNMTDTRGISVPVNATDLSFEDAAKVSGRWRTC